MRRDPKQFRERFQRWKNGELVYDAGLPKYEDGKDYLYKGRDLQEIVITPLNQSVPELESPLPTLEEYMGEFMQQQYGILTPYQWQKNFREQRLKMAVPI